MTEQRNQQQPIVRATEERVAEPPPLAAAVAGARARRTERAPSSPHSRKFRAVTGALAGLGIGAVAVAIAILAGGGSGGPSAPWAPWHPTGGRSLAPREIADHVAPFYRATPSEQLVVITVSDLASGGNGLQLALRSPSSGTLQSVPGHSVVYNLCGLGANCAISAGTPSAARLLLLRREALELALYTFRYVSGVDNVVSILPPGRTTGGQLTSKPPNAQTAATATTKPLSVAVVFQRQDVQHWLDRPLRLTLPEDLPPTVSQMSIAPEAELVSLLTGQGLFQQHLVQAQDGSSVLVLDPMPPQ
jgi:hypothetical protein